LYEITDIEQLLIISFVRSEKIGNPHNDIINIIELDMDVYKTKGYLPHPCVFLMGLRWLFKPIYRFMDEK